MDIAELLKIVIGGLIKVIGILLLLLFLLYFWIFIPYAILKALIDWLNSPTKIKKKESRYDWRSNKYLVFVVWVLIIYLLFFLNTFVCNHPRDAFDPRGF